MRLAALLAELPPDELERLGAEHLGQDENVSRTALCTTLEGVLRSYSFVRKFVGDRFPPTFSILELLLDAEGHACPASTFRELVTHRTGVLVDRVARGDLVARNDTLHLYRQVLLEARRNDLVLDASETAILGVLRRELNIRTVEHFLLEHHSEFHEFWTHNDAFLEEMTALRSAGLVFGHGGNVVISEEVEPLLRQTLGIEMPTRCRQRLYGHLSGGDLGEVLGQVGLKQGGNRDERLERLVASYVQPTEVLRHLPLQTLRELCGAAKAPASGSKAELVERLVDQFRHELDVRPESDVPPAPPPDPEPRTLDEMRFHALFSFLKGDDLTDVLAGIDSRRITGAKDTKVAILTASRFCENTLLGKLTNRALEESLGRLHLRTAGSKQERVDRFIEYFRTVPEFLLAADVTAGTPAPAVSQAAGGADVPDSGTES